MTFEIAFILSILVPVAALAAGTILYLRAITGVKNEHRQVRELKESIPKLIKEQTRELSAEVDKFNLEAARLEDYVTRHMRTAAAKSSRTSKELERLEYLQELMKQSRETEEDPEQAELFQANGEQPKLRRRKR